MKPEASIPTEAATPSKQAGQTTAGCKEILVPIDFSKSSVTALHRAAEMAERERAHLTLLNVIDEPISFRTLDAEGEERRRRQKHADDLRDLAERELGPNVRSDLMVCEGNPWREITRAAARRHASLIVMGRHEHHGLGRWLHSHTANRVVEGSPCPVVVLDEEEPEPAKAVR